MPYISMLYTYNRGMYDCYTLFIRILYIRIPLIMKRWYLTLKIRIFKIFNGFGQLQREGYYA